MLARIAMAALASVSMVTSALAWDGARANFLRPAGASDISLTTTLLHAKGTVVLPDAELDVGVVTPTYHHVFDAMGNVGTVLIGLPIGGVSFESSLAAIDDDSGIAQGDLVVGAGLGLVGMPALAPMDYVQHKPGFQAMVEAKLFLPTGDYDASRTANLGLNRWSFQASLPISYALGDSLIDPELMTFEIRPVVQIFGDNDDPVGPATVQSTAPVFGVEGHITRNFGNSIWAAVDGYYEIGGENTYNGVPQGDEVETLALGATLGLVFSPSFAVRASYRHLVYSNIPDAQGHALEITSAFLF